MILPATPNDLFEISRVWRKCFPENYFVTESQIRALTFGTSLFWEEGSCIYEGEFGWCEAFVICKKNPDFDDLIHVHTFGFLNVNAGKKVLNHMVNLCNNEGYRLIFGQDRGHFFPGVPEECGEHLALLSEVGFDIADEICVDFQRDLAGFDISATSKDALHKNQAIVRRCEEGDIPYMSEFLQREFPGRWYDDTVSKMSREPEDVFCLVIDEEIEGFAYTQSQKSTKLPLSGCVWHLSLGENWGGLGPIGVSKKVRGLKLGGALLETSLLELSKSGVRECVIDWTSLVDFYPRYGYEVSRRYRICRRSPK